MEFFKQTIDLQSRLRTFRRFAEQVLGLQFRTELCYIYDKKHLYVQVTDLYNIGDSAFEDAEDILEALSTIPWSVIMGSEQDMVDYLANIEEY